MKRIFLIVSLFSSLCSFAQLQVTSGINAVYYPGGTVTGQLKTCYEKRISFTLKNTGTTSIQRGIKLFLTDASGNNMIDVVWGKIFTLAAGTSITYDFNSPDYNGNYGLSGAVTSPPGSYKLVLKAINTSNIANVDFNTATTVPVSGSGINPLSLTITDGSYINVTSPSGGSYNVNATLPITWTQCGITGNVNIELVDAANNSNVVSVVATNVANSGSYNWTIPTSIPSGNYQIKIYKTGCTTSSNCISDVSNIFAIVNNSSTPTLVVNSPVLNNTFPQTGTLPVTWSTSNYSGNISITLINANTNAIVQTIASNISNSLSYNYTIPCSVNPDFYKVRVYSPSNPSLQDFSASFEITSSPGCATTTCPFNYTIAVSQPTAGASYNSGNPLTMNWSSTGLAASDYVSFELWSSDGTTFIRNLFPTTGTINDGNEVWTVPSDIPTGQYKLKAYKTGVQLTQGCFFGWSPVFTINQTSTTPSLVLTAPTLSQTVSCGSNLSITWNSSNIPSTTNVKLDLLVANTSTFYSNIVSQTPNSGSYSWPIPNTIAGDVYKVKITALNAQSTTTTGASFTISCSVSFNCVLWNTTPTSAELDNEAALAFDYLCSKFVIRKTQYKAEINNLLLREELAKISFRGLYLPSSETDAGPATPADNFPVPFIDLQTGSTNYSREAKVMSYLEYANGISPFKRSFTHFYPKKNIQRQYALKEIMEAFNVLPNPTSTPYPSGVFVNDVASTVEMKGYITKALDLGLITPNPTTFRPFDNITRKEAFLILYRLMKKYDNGSLTPRPAPTAADFFTPNNVSPDNFSRLLDIMQASFNSYTKTSFGVSGTVPLSFAHSYNSYLTELPDNYQSLEPLGKGWNHNYNCYIQFVQGDDPSEDRYIITWGDGTMVSFIKNGTVFTPETKGIYATLTQNLVQLVYTTKNQIKYVFSQVGNTSIWGLKEVKDRNSNTLYINWESPTGVPRVKKVYVNAASRYLDFVYNASNQLTNVSCVTGSITRGIAFTFSTEGDLKTYVDPKNQTTTYFYAGANDPLTEHLLTGITLPRGNTITNTYQQRKLQSSKINNQFTANVGFNTAYSNSGVSTNSNVQITRNGQTLASSYSNNNLGLVTQATTPTANIGISYNSSQPTLPQNISNSITNTSAGMTYDASGNVLTATRTGGSQSLTESFTYNAFNDVLTHTNARGNTTQFTYDGNGNLTNVKDALNNNTSIIVNGDGTVNRVTNPTGLYTTFDYDIWGNSTRSSVMGVLNSLATYDDASRVTQTTDPNGIKAKYSYDAVDQVLEVISDFGGLNNSLKYEYDANGNLTKITNPKNIATNLTYDNNDQMVQYSFAGLNKYYTYNEDGTVKQFTNQRGDVTNYLYYPDGQLQDDGYATYQYDAQKRLWKVTHKTNNSVVTYSYDSFNRISSVGYNAGSYSDIVGYQYDNNSNITKITYPGGFAVGYSYDALDRLTTVYNFSTNAPYATYTYMNDGRLLKTTNGNGTYTDYTYDSYSRPIGISNMKQNASLINSYSFTLDNVGNHTQETANEPYAPAMPAVVSATVPYAHDNANRMNTQGSTTFNYDGNGNNTAASGQWNNTATYDRNDNLLTNTSPSLSCEYDGMENRRKRNANRFVLELLGGSNVLMEVDGAGAPVAYYVHGFGMVCRLDAAASNPAYYHYDYRGSTTAITDAAQNITHKYLYGAFGEMMAANETGFTNAYRYVGKYGVQYEDSTLYYMRARYYNPIKGRFLGEDPVWSYNLYAYAENNSQTQFDASGKSPESIIEVLKSLSDIYNKVGPALTSVATSTALLQKGMAIAKSIRALSAIEARAAAASAESLLGGLEASPVFFIFLSPIFQYLDVDMMKFEQQGMIVAANKNSVSKSVNNKGANSPIRNVDAKGTASFTDPGYQVGFDGIGLYGASNFNRCSKFRWYNPATWFAPRCK